MQQNIAQFFVQYPWVAVLIALWSLPWKGAALWRAARNKHEWWFIVLLVLNTAGVLEILYIFIFGRKK